MANRNFKRVQSLNNQTKIIAGRVQLVASVPTKLSGLGFNIVEAGAGSHQIVLEDKYPTLLAATFGIEGASATVEILSEDVQGTGTIDLDGLPSACIIHVVIMLNNSGVA